MNAELPDPFNDDGTGSLFVTVRLVARWHAPEHKLGGEHGSRGSVGEEYEYRLSDEGRETITSDADPTAALADDITGMVLNVAEMLYKNRLLAVLEPDLYSVHVQLSATAKPFVDVEDVEALGDEWGLEKIAVEFVEGLNPEPKGPISGPRGPAA